MVWESQDFLMPLNSLTNTEIWRLKDKRNPEIKRNPDLMVLFNKQFTENERWSMCDKSWCVEINRNALDSSVCERW